ncbi:MAG: AAA family ATPase [Treponema sp.]|jgi:hypothetical protein|nr:AAA family ATPase [Treponema sp.]
MKFISLDAGLKEACRRIEQCMDLWETELDLSDLGLEEVPSELERGSFIAVLTLAHNRLQDLPPWFERFNVLQHLDLSNNRLAVLPRVICSIPQLKSLNLRGNELSSLPESMEGLSSLETLDLSRNRLNAVPEALGSMKALRKLDLNLNRIDKLPEKIRRLSSDEPAGLVSRIAEVFDLLLRLGLSADFYREAAEYLRSMSQHFGITRTQSALFAFFLANYDDFRILENEIIRTLNIRKLDFLQYRDDLLQLERKGLINCFRNEGYPMYSVSERVMSSLIQGEKFKNERYQQLYPGDFFEALADLYEKRYNNTLSYNMLTAGLKQLLAACKSIPMVKKLRSYKLDDDSLVLLLHFCQLQIGAPNDYIRASPFKRELYDNAALYRQIREQLDSAEHDLFRLGLIEKQPVLKNSRCRWYDNTCYRLSEKAKQELLPELVRVNRHKRRIPGAFRPESPANIPEKALFYNPAEEKQVLELSSLLEEEKFKAVQTRLAESSLRSGFVCLFSGPPGTGKTETACQLARRSGRAILKADVAEIMDKWVGESEKKLRRIFGYYRRSLEKGEPAPILFFNEADQILSRRMHLNADSRSVDQMFNSLQNILLEETENFPGIMIAATNMTDNLDKAFERRFLYRISFRLPGPGVRTRIWRTMLPALTAGDAETLAGRYDFSGGQIENVVRKALISYVLSGNVPTLESLTVLCDEEGPAGEISKYII